MFVITAEEARELTTSANPIELEIANAVQDTFLVIRAQANRGFPNAIKYLYKDQQFYANEVIKALREAGFTAESIKEKDSTILSISWL
jgi:hypothetical protein